MVKHMRLLQLNTPTKPGYYLCKRPDMKTELAEIRIEHGSALWVHVGISCFPLEHLDDDDVTWSDELILSFE